MIEKTEAQPEALRLELHQECADFASSLRSAANVVQLQGQKAPPSFLKAADLFEQVASEIQQLKAQLTSQTNRAAAAEQQVTALTQRLNMANRLNTDARNELAQLSARQAAPNPWQQAIDHELVCLHLGVAEDTTQESAAKALRELIQCHVEIAINPQTNGGLTLQPHGTPPPPEREPLTDEQILQLFIEMYGQEPVDITEFAEVCGRVEKQHGIGATND